MRYLSLQCLCIIKNPGCFSAYGGSMLRGVLGNHLRRSFCVTKKDNCKGCMLSVNCVFPKLFTVSSDSPVTLAPPFCIEPPLDLKRDYAPGDKYIFTLKIFSYAVEYVPYFIHAFTQAGKRGMGKGSEYGSGSFEIIDIIYNGASIYNAAEEKLGIYEAEEIVAPRLVSVTEERELKLNFLTPARFKEANHLSARLEFSQFINLIIRRMKNLWALEGENFRMSQAEFAAVKDISANVKIKNNSLQWQDWSRFSNRQNTLMRLGGLAGLITYTGPVAVFREFFDFAVRFHIGKQTSFGLGACAYKLI